MPSQQPTLYLGNRRRHEGWKEERSKEGSKKERRREEKKGGYTQLTGLSSCASVAVKEQLWVRLPDETG